LQGSSGWIEKALPEDLTLSLSKGEVRIDQPSWFDKLTLKARPEDLTLSLSKGEVRAATNSDSRFRGNDPVDLSRTHFHD